MKVFNLPDLGEGLQDAEIVRWLVNEGDRLSVDQPMVEMETAKAVVEVPSPYDGAVTRLHGQPGDVIAVGAPLVEFDGAKSTASTEAKQAPSPAATQAPANSQDEVFFLPDLGEGLQDAEIVRWLKNEGDNVEVDEPIVEMETAKAVVEVPSPFKGRIKQFHGGAGDVIAVGAPLVSFGTGKASASASKADAKKPADAGTVVGAVEVSDRVSQESSSAVVRALAKKLKVDLSQVSGSGPNGKITQQDVKNAAGKSGTSVGLKASTPQAQSPSPSPLTTEVNTSNPLAYRASPAVRAHAKRLGVELSLCNASGKKGSITRADVENAAKQGGGVQAPAPSAGQTTVSRPGASKLPSITKTVHPEPVRGVRRAMAQAMTLASQQVCLTTLVDDANIHNWTKGNNPTVRLIRALARACHQEPALNAWFDGENMERLLHPNVDVGIAVDMPDGLYVPVIRNAESKTADEIRSDLNTLIDKIKTKTIRPEDLANPTITMSNFGTIAGRYGTPVVVPPQVGILGSGSFKDELKLTERGIENQRHIPLSLSFDHRACTGGEAARCLRAIIDDLSLAK